ncbi:hypothetical protein [Caenispirillum bisanense]|uniref:hypothetical protein n=1 Tax=Caenispirillum bisanense TaxID=414052 RepID=UPI0031E3AAC9
MVVMPPVAALVAVFLTVLAPAPPGAGEGAGTAFAAEGAGAAATGAEATGTAAARATVAVTAADADAAGRGDGYLTLLLEPVRTVPREPYLVVIEARPGNAPEAEAEPIGSVAFHPPPRDGDVGEFILTVPRRLLLRAADDGGLVVSVRLMPAAEGGRLTTSALRIAGASLRRP